MDWISGTSKHGGEEASFPEDDFAREPVQLLLLRVHSGKTGQRFGSEIGVDVEARIRASALLREGSVREIGSVVDVRVGVLLGGLMLASDLARNCDVAELGSRREWWHRDSPRCHDAARQMADKFPRWEWLET